jgi:hypothetical protein
VLREKYYCKIDLPWLSQISKQIRASNYEANSFDYDSAKSTEVKVLFEFKDIVNG